MARVRSRYPVVLHGVGLNLLGHTPLDEGYIDALCRLADFPHTYVKISAFYALGKKAAPYTDLGPLIKKVVAAFGASRCMWESDCPFQVADGHAYRPSVDLVRKHLEFLTGEGALIEKLTTLPIAEC